MTRMTNLELLPTEFFQVDTTPKPVKAEPKLPEFKLYYEPVFASLNKVNWVNEPRIQWNIWLRGVDADWGWDPSSRSTNIIWEAYDSDTVIRWAGTVYLADWTTTSIRAWNTTNMTAVTYIYYDGTTSLQTTTTPQNSVWDGKILMCVAAPTSWWDAQFQAFGTLGNWVFITADNIAANTITANEMAANSVTATEINVSNLSAISASMGTLTSGTITWWTIQTDTSWNGEILARYGTSWTSTYKEIKMHTESNIPTLEFTYNNSAVWEIKGSSFTIDWSTTSALSLVTPSTSDYVYTNWTMYMAGKMRIPVWTNLYN